MSDIQHDSSSENKSAESGKPGSTPAVTSSLRKIVHRRTVKNDSLKCKCKDSDDKPSVASTQFEKLLKQKEKELRADYEKILEREKQLLKDRFQLILLNEQTRTSNMLREAHRERQEKIFALQTQLQCKNLAALMYVMCTERRRSKIEKLKIIKDYTEYIGVLQDILVQGQDLILHLSRGYKTAARVDHEWREKMKKVVREFMAFIYDFAGGDPETNQYFLDLPKLLTTKTSLIDNPEEDPCYEEEKELDDTPIYEKPVEKSWWDELEGEDRPFVMYGDMADFEPCQRREVLKKIKAKKTAPAVWNKYAFREMFLTSQCVNLDSIKDKYQLPVPIKWECEHAQNSHPENVDIGEHVFFNRSSRASLSVIIKPRTQSMDIRGMGSILKIVTSTPTAPSPSAKTALLAARDSMEIASTTKMRHSTKHENIEISKHKDVVLDIGKKRTSVFAEVNEEETKEEQEVSFEEQEYDAEVTEKASISFPDVDKEDGSTLGDIHIDSLEMKQPRETHSDKVHYERVCPMEKCQRLHVDSFMRSLPPYMRANPFTHFEQTFDEYETCTPEQLEILRQRIEQRKHTEFKENEEVDPIKGLLDEWASTGVGVQTSDIDFLSPCTCEVKDSAKSVSSGFMFNVADLMPVKQAMDAIHRECFFDDRIIFDRFKVVGQDKDNSEHEEDKKVNLEFKHARYEEIKKILTKHPSLLEIFQANAR